MAGGDLKCCNIKGDSLLHVAARLNRPDLINYLVEFGVNPNEPNKMGVLPREVLPDKRHEKLFEVGGAQASFDLYQGSMTKPSQMLAVAAGTQSYMMPKSNPNDTFYTRTSRNTQSTFQPGSSQFNTTTGGKFKATNPNANASFNQSQKS